jgi:ABC-type transport system involved in cytochrome c biogenesis permease subunit
MTAPLQHVTYTCFGLSYLLAFLLELARVRWPRRWLRLAGLAFGALGLLTHTAFLAFRHPPPADPDGGLLTVAWVLAVFYLYGTVHHGRQAWAVFVLPVVLGLIGLAFARVQGPLPSDAMPWPSGDRTWGVVHGSALLLAAVGVSVGFLASVMYLVQAARLRAKTNPLGGLSVLSLERLEAMNRRAVNAAFPLLTIGLVLGAALVKPDDESAGWLSVKALGTVGLWLAFVVLLYLRYAAHVPGRRLALLTIGAFGLMVVVLAANHPFAPEVGR